MHFTIFGGGQEIGANAYFLEWHGRRILLDAGMNPAEQGYHSLVPVDEIGPLDAVMISHGHFDHIGSLPLVYKLCSPRHVFIPAEGFDIVRRMLWNTANVITRLDKQSKDYAFSRAYERNNMDELFEEALPDAMAYDQEFPVTPEITGRFFNAGHVLGSAGIILSDGEKSLVYTGDIGVNPHGIHPGMSLPDCPRPDILLMEGTTAAEPSSWDEMASKKAFWQEIRDAADRKGQVLIPAFALGRTQDILALIHEGKCLDDIPDIPVYVSGLGNAISEIYENRRHELRPEYSQTPLTQMAIATDSQHLLDLYRNHVKQKQTAIYISTNGMMEPWTGAAMLAQRMVESPKHAILFTGYQAPGTLGYDVLNAPVDTRLDFRMTKGRQGFATIRTPYRKNFRFSAHASRDELISVVEHFDPKELILIHGDGDALQALKKSLPASRPIHIPHNGDMAEMGKNALQWLNTLPAIIMTVGTSLLGNFRREYPDREITLETVSEFLKRHINDSRAPSAEIQTWREMEADAGERVYLFVSDDPDGELCGRALESIFPKGKAHMVCIPGLKSDFQSFQQEGLPNLIQALIRFYQRHEGKVRIVATGGYKAETAMVTLAGSVLDIPVYYIHEDFKHVIRMDPLPISWDIQHFKSYIREIETVLSANTLSAGQEVMETSLPKDLHSLFVPSQVMNQWKLTPLGLAMRESIVRRIRDEKRRRYLDPDPEIHNRVHPWGQGRIYLKRIPDSSVRLLLNTLFEWRSHFRYVTYGRLLPKKEGLSTVIFHHDTPDRLVYHLKSPAGGLEIVVHAYRGSVNDLLKKLGKTIRM
ncbi:MAG: putative CRISPR-associated protein [Candidatus Marinimicrobia bacterium]|nr:putative CRISPR-associated protein [Candidatus Neomarinimicrobiota bacterium]